MPHAGHGMLLLLLGYYCSSSCDEFLCSFFSRVIWNSMEAFCSEDLLDQDHPVVHPTILWMIAQSPLSDFQVYNSWKLDELDQSPLSEWLICYCKVCRYSGNFAVREVFFYRSDDPLIKNNWGSCQQFDPPPAYVDIMIVLANVVALCGHHLQIQRTTLVTRLPPYLFASSVACQWYVSAFKISFLLFATLVVRLILCKYFCT